MAIIDVFLGNDEIRLAEFRISYLQDHVDKVLIGESSRTFSGKPKVLHFSKYLKDHPDIVDRVRVVEIPLPEGLLEAEDRWGLEEFSRDFLLETAMKDYPQDTLIFSDLDEVPSRRQVLEILELEPHSAADIPMKTFIRFANWETRLKGKIWRKAKALRAVAFSRGIRYKSFLQLKAKDGAHFSYLGLAPEGIRRKYESFSHLEYDHPEFSSSELIEFAEAYGVNHTGRAHDPDYGLVDVQKIIELSELQKAAISFEPGWSSYVPSGKPKALRIAASWDLTMKIHSPQHRGNDSTISTEMSSIALAWNLMQAYSYRLLSNLGLQPVVHALSKIVTNRKR
jgi:beta-1,4-mannosyl-glycoprotein beta-1,4-N-acetylglucosaminyltransferase